MKMCSIAFYPDIIMYRYSRSHSIPTTSGNLTLFADDHDYMADGRGCSCIIHCCFGISMLQNQKVNYKLQFIRSRCNSAFMQWLNSEDKLNTNNPIILKSLLIINICRTI
jgi:hypothetical protein